MKPRGTYRNFATFSQHDGTVDSSGHPTYMTSTDWDSVASNVPGSLEAASGSETLRGTQVVENTSHVFHCDYKSASVITSDMRCVINGKTYGIVSILPADDIDRDMMIQLRSES